jgi:hypothetical protein
MITNQPLTVLPVEIQQDYQATLQRYVDPDAQGHFYLVGIRRSGVKDWQSQRITVQAVDENGFPLPNLLVAFSYSTAEPYILTPDFLWNPPPPQRAFIVPTAGSGAIDQVQGDVVKQGQPGGVTVYALQPEFSSDVITGLGMLFDHTGVILTLQLRRNGVTSLADKIAELERRVAALGG